uniref:Uncharacterized protein n=1 Tax=Lepeophtheirus salmonis TaxID=72036 RepID=A0A0K2UU74_LEPSM
MEEPRSEVTSSSFFIPISFFDFDFSMDSGLL